MALFIENVSDYNYPDAISTMRPVNVPDNISKLEVIIDNGRVSILINGVEIFKHGSLVDGSIVLEKVKIAP